MKEHNKHNLPERVLRLLPNRYQPKPDRIGVTALIDAARIRTLQLEKWDEIVCDRSDLLSTLIGISVHDRAEKFATDDEEAEQKLEFTQDSKGKLFGITLVMKADNFFNKEIIDTKTKAVGFKRFGLEKETAQLNIYAWGQRMSFNKVDRLLLDVYYRDHKLSEAKYKADYPKISYECIELPLWTFEEQEQYIWDRLHYHAASPMDCGDEDRWKKNDSYAVMVKGRKRALRVLPTEQEAKEWMQSNERGEYIEKREGSCVRCESYCNCRTVCHDSPCYLGEKNAQ